MTKAQKHANEFWTRKSEEGYGDFELFERALSEHVKAPKPRAHKRGKRS